jgi:hypothetical protein
VGQFLLAVTNGKAREICCFGARGDGKTIGALMAMVAHAQQHAAAGYPLPVPWIGVSDTFQSHKLKTIRSINNPLWQGLWRTSEQGHIAEFCLDGQTLVKLDLFGIEDQGAMDRVRLETCGVWFEEAAPSAVMVQSAGISESAWDLALTSQRVPTHCKPAMITENYPEDDHWTWRRFVTKPGPGTMYFRVPPGERASAEDRAEWERALAHDPALLARLVHGEPAVLSLGDHVATGFSTLYHIAKTPIKPEPGVEIGIGFDGGHTPTAVIGQQVRNGVRVYAALTQDNSGMRQLLEDQVLPWLARNSPWVLRNPSDLLVGYDPSLDVGEQADIDNSALNAINEALGYPSCEPGPVRWPNRKDALIQALSRKDGLLIDPSCDLLIKALNGRWYYPKSHIGELRSDNPKKPNHPWEDLGDSLIYLLCRFGIVGAAMWSDNTFDDVKILANYNH